MLTVKEAAARLGVSPALVYTLCARGRLTHERYGTGRGTIRIAEEDVVAFRQHSRVAAPADPLPPTAATYRVLNACRLAAAWRRHGIMVDGVDGPT